MIHSMKRLGLGLVALVTACGGTTTSGGGSSACSVACGGDVVGRWEFVSYCGSNVQQTSNGNCTTTVERLTAAVTGTLEYRLDGTYSMSGTSSGTVRLTYSQACLTYGTLTITCDQFSQMLQTQAAGADGGLTSASCASVTGGACVCTFAVVGQPMAITGTYVTSGSVLTMVETSVSQDDYCVQDDRLTVTPRESGDAGAILSASTGTVWKRVQ
jgi:hypothetical protein